jgi:hypothetical protein
VRPVLPPTLRRLWRDRETLQLGRPPGPAAVLTGVDPPVRAALALLDGTREPHQVLADARTAGCPPERAAALLDLLDEAGLLDDAGRPLGLGALSPAERDALGPDLAAVVGEHGRSAGDVLTRRRAARVVVRGAGRVGSLVAALLATSGVAAVVVDDPEAVRPQDTGPAAADLADCGQGRAEVARQRLARVAPSAVGVPAAADLEVLCRPGPLPDGPHLVAEVRDGVGIVGPLVVPGRTPCLRCLDLTRTDLDPDWPALSAQLPEREGPAPVVLAAAVAAQAAAQALHALDGAGRPATAGGTLELAPPDWRWRRRTWPVHPDCGCGAAL